MKNKHFLFVISFLGLLFSIGCSNTKYLSKDQNLLIKNAISLEGNLSNSEGERLKNSLESSSIIEQRPNQRFLEIFRMKLWFYNKKFNDDKTGKLWNWLLIDKNMEPPVLFDSALAEKTANNMESFLNNQGYFYATADYGVATKKQKTKVAYEVKTNKVFEIDSVSYDMADTTIKQILQTGQENTLITKGDPFTVDQVSKERERLATIVRDSGYYDFSTADIQFVLDTINKSIFRSIFDPFSSLENEVDKDQQPKLDLSIQLAPTADSGVLRPYFLRNIYVYPDFSAFDMPDDSLYRQEEYEGLSLFYREDFIRPRVLREAIRLQSGDRYSEEVERFTIQRLNNLGLWKFVNLEFKTVPNTSDSLDGYAFLMPGKRQELGANIETTTSAGDYIIGGALNLNYQNKNVNQTANKFKINLKGGLEWNSKSNGNLFVQAREFSGEASLTFPRFIAPFKIRSAGRSANPQTTLALGFNFLQRLNFFTWTSIKGSYGYDWNVGRHKQWIFHPFSLNFNHVSHVSPSFKAQLDANPFLKNSFSSVFIEGEDLSFIYNDQRGSFQTDVNFLRLDGEESGLLLNGINGIIKGTSQNRSNFKKLTSVDYSQFVRLSGEYKHYYNRRHSTLVARAFAGAGLPYGNSEVLPYIKQFTAGGPNSLRAWRLRALGPGIYHDPDIDDRSIFPDQTGEMKLEANLEYRFDILTLFQGFMGLKGATFLDAGNIWNMKSENQKPGSRIKLSRFYRDIAVGGGVGLRLDFSYAIIRLDVATPLKEPYISKRNGWISEPIQILDRNWRHRKLIFNFAVGYPF